MNKILKITFLIAFLASFVPKPIGAEKEKQGETQEVEVREDTENQSKNAHIKIGLFVLVATPVIYFAVRRYRKSQEKEKETPKVGEIDLQAMDKEFSKSLESLRKKGPNTKDEDGMTPLHYAAFIGDDASVKDLIKKGAKVNAKVEKKEYTPLHFAAFRDKKSTYELLEKNGADPNAKDKNGNTPKSVKNDMKLVRALEKCIKEKKQKKKASKKKKETKEKQEKKPLFKLEINR